MKTWRRGVFQVLAYSALCSSLLRGETLYWTGPSTTWSTGTAAWADDIGGTGPAQAWHDGASAHFTASSVTPPYPATLILSGTVSVNDITTNGSDYFVLYPSGGATLATADATMTMQINDTSILMANTPVTGSGGLTKSGSGSLYLFGGSSYTGDTLVQQGIFSTSGAAHTGGGNFTVDAIAGATATATLAASSTNANVTIGATAAGVSNTTYFNGSAAEWTVQDTLTVGAAGTGRLSVQNGAALNTVTTVIGDGTGSSGQITLSNSAVGYATSWINHGDLIVGRDGAGTLVVSSGSIAKVAAGGSAYIGYGAGPASSLVQVIGAGSKWITGDRLVVGKAGNGTLALYQGALVQSQDAIIAAEAGSTGSVLLTDPGSRWEVAGELVVGGLGDGLLQASSGSAVTSGSAVVGAGAGANASVVLNGGIWENTGSLVVGESASSAFVTVWGGSSLTSGSYLLGQNAGSHGSTWVFGGSLETTASLTLGDAGGAYFQATAGSTITTGGDAILAAQATGSATASISGSGTQWTISGNLFVGQLGLADLTVASGAAIQAGAIILGGDPGSQGTLTISDSGTRVTTAALFIGFNGTSHVVVRDGGELNVTNPLQGIHVSSGSELNIGDNSTAGTVNAPQVNLASGATLRFQHTTADYIFNTRLSGTGVVSQSGTGSTTITSSSIGMFSGTVQVERGTLRTTDAYALGTGSVTLSGGTLAPSGTLNIQSLTWNDGRISLAAGADFLNIANTLTLGADGGVFTLSGLAANVTYDLLSAPNLDASMLGLFSLAGGATGLNAVFSLDGSTLRLTLSGAATGPVLQNNGGPFTPTNADFLVSGAVQTATSADSNTVNSLTFAPGSQLTVHNTLGVTSGNLTVTGGEAALAGDLVVLPGGFTKLGPGLLNLLATLIASGPASITQGVLSVNGVLAAPDVIVQPGAWLQGIGVILGNVLNQGGVAPGNSPGTLTITGDYTQTPSGTLQIEIASPTVYDRLLVGGQAVLAGTLDVQTFGGFSGLQYGQQYAFLQAGGISGGFDTITMPDPALYRGRFLAEGGTGILLVAPASYTLVAETQNQRNVARALDAFIGATGDRDTVSTALDLQSASQYPAAFDAILPAYYQTLTGTTIEQAVAQTQMIAQRLGAVRLGARGFQAMGLEAPLKNDRNGKNVLDARDGKDLLAPAPDNRWGVWALGNGVFSKVATVNDLPGYRFQNGGFFVGADYAWSENLTTGLFGGYQGAYAKYANGSMASANSALFGGYAAFQSGGFYSDAIVSGGYNGYVAKRSIQFSTIDRTARATPDGGQLSAYLDLGHDWRAGGFTFGPLVSAQYTYSGIAPFTESGADSLDLRVEQQNASSLRTNLGGRISYTWNIASGLTLIPEVRMFWQHEYLQNSTTIGASLDGGAGPSFDYSTTVPARDSVFAGAGLSAAFGRNLGAFVYYNADFGRQDYLSHMISTGLNWKF